MARALSHLTLWRHISATENELHAIFEDDIELRSDWIASWNDVYAHEIPANTYDYLSVYISLV